MMKRYLLRDKDKYGLSIVKCPEGEIDLQIAATPDATDAIEFAGEIADIITRPPAIEYQLAEAWQALKDERTANIDSGLDTRFGRFDTDEASRSFLSSAVTASVLQGERFSIAWKLSDNSIVNLNAIELKEVAMAVFDMVEAEFAETESKWAERKAQILAGE